MSETERLVTFELLGQEHKFYTAASEEEMNRILSLVRQLVEIDPDQKTGTLPVGKIAVMACLNIASRHVKLQQDFELYKRGSEDRITQLNDEIKRCLLADE